MGAGGGRVGVVGSVEMSGWWRLAVESTWFASWVWRIGLCGADEGGCWGLGVDVLSFSVGLVCVSGKGESSVRFAGVEEGVGVTSHVH